MPLDDKTELRVIRKIDIEPGDIILVRVPTAYQESANRILENCQRFFKETGATVIGCPADIDLEIYGRKK